jgi:hypothetical protein
MKLGGRVPEGDGKMGPWPAEVIRGGRLGDWGIRTSRWEDLHIVGAWKGFLADPGLYFLHLLDG